MLRLGLTFIAAAVLSAALVRLLHRLLVRYALARPNARSSHRVPTPQGGGIAVLGSVIAVLATATPLLAHVIANPGRLAVVLAATATLAVVGAIDDIRPIEPMPRLLLQAIAVTIVIAVLPLGLRVEPMLPWWVERALLAIGMLWFVNLVNFMDGIDWITVAEIVPITAMLSLFGWYGALPADATLAAVALCGAMIGFAPFNKPVARLFLGDVGSLPIGLLSGWLLILLAERHLAAALLLPLYYLADATITLLRRLVRGERVTQAHRSHFYQQAVDNGRSVQQVVASIFALNILLAVLAAVTIGCASIEVELACVAVGGGAVAAELTWLGRRRPQP